MRFIVLGVGRLGARLARTLAERGHSVVAVDPAPAAAARLGRSYTGSFIAGTPLERQTLIDAGIERADGIAAVTADEEANLVAARMARLVFRVPRAVARLEDARLADIARRGGVQPLTMTAWGVRRAEEVLCYAELDPVLRLGDGQVDLVEVTVPALLAGRAARDVMLPGEAQVVAVRRAGAYLLPSAATVIEAGDQLLYVVLASAGERFRRLLGLA
jgi:trk system potassium uptake protein TrkA